MTDIVTQDLIEKKIFLIRGLSVMLDKDLAELYGVPTKRLIEQVKRNTKRFPDDFMFQLTEDEFKILRSQNATSRWGGRRYFPYVFTEQGVAIIYRLARERVCSLDFNYGEFARIKKQVV